MLDYWGFFPTDNSTLGVTSERNQSFVESLGLYDEVITYDAVDQLDPSVASAMVDRAGSASVRTAIHTHFNDRLKASLTVGATHWQDGGGGGSLPGPTPEGVESAYRALLEGRAEPDTGYVVSMHQGAFS